MADGRVDFQAMRLAEVLAAGIRHLARRERVIVLGVNEEDRRRDVVNGGQEPLATPEDGSVDLFFERRNDCASRFSEVEFPYLFRGLGRRALALS